MLKSNQKETAYLLPISLCVRIVDTSPLVVLIVLVDNCAKIIIAYNYI